MANKMIIDASHPEETRVVVLRGNRIEEFDFEAASKKPLRGNIYLAKVTRVEPSLQAAFIEYGGNRHGFLAFSEIHPDYYQIPVADRQALIEDQARQQREEEEDEGRHQRRGRRPRRNDRFEKRARPDESLTGEIPISEDSLVSTATELGADEAEAESNPPMPEEMIAASSDDSIVGEIASEAVEASLPVAETPHETIESAPVLAAIAPDPVAVSDEPHAGASDDAQAVPDETPEMAAPAPIRAEDAEAAAAENPSEIITSGEVSEITGEAPTQPSEPLGNDEDEDDEEDDDEHHEEEQVEQVGGDDFEEAPQRAFRPRRQYKIQEVIKRRQVLLVQVVKEERGNKGAALTTYLSLAGRYSVLMPNTARGGGVSRKITDIADRKRLKSLVQELEVPEGMGIILRTAGAARSKQEIRRDFEYLLRMWETVRELTLRSTAPTLVYEEGSLIKRSIRDLYNKDIDDITVAGEAAFREARDFMRLLTPSHVRNVIPWREPQPIFARFGIEAQLDSMFSNQVTLRSGGYIVINQTEALVAIDVNSGRSTREHNIEDTALRTNLEAADEVARQLRLRDLAGLIVVDFIDMEENRNNRAVERRMKDALRNDRARIQIGRISHFGLLEMSRQRMRTGVLEGSTVPCSHCMGAGIVRSTSSLALHVLRVLEDSLIKSATHNMTVRTRGEVALYILNQKRSHLREIERRFGVTITVLADASLTGGVFHALERGDLAAPPVEFEAPDVVRVDSINPGEYDVEPEDEPFDEPETTEDETDEEGATETVEGAENDADDAEGDQRRKRRRRRRRGRGDRESSGVDAHAPQPSDAGLAVMAEIGGDIPADLKPISDGEVDEFDVEADAAELTAGEDSASGEGSGDQRPRRRRRNRRPRRGERQDESGASERGPGRWTQSYEPTEDGAGESDDQPASTELSAAAEAAAPAPMASATEPETVRQPEPEHPIEQMSEPQAAPEPDAQRPEEPTSRNEPPPARLIEAEEARPPEVKRGGWWQRAKASFGGG